MFRGILTFGLIVLFVSIAQAKTIYIPQDYPTIQQGIDAAVNGDTVLVAPGTYVENINFKGKAVTVTSELGPEVTVIDGNQDGSVVTCGSGEGSDSVLEGFTITNGKALNGGGMHNFNSNPKITNCIFSKNFTQSLMWPYVIPGIGGGMYNSNSSPTVTKCTFAENEADGIGGGMCNFNSNPIITHCTFSNNLAGYTFFSGIGGGMYNDNSHPTVTSCTFSGNLTDWIGGGMSNYYSNPIISNCIFYGNSASGDNMGEGGGMRNMGSSPIISNCTFSGNLTDWIGGGMCNWETSSPIVTNTVLWNNDAPEGPEIWIGDTTNPSTLTISFSNVKGGQASVYVDPNCALNWGLGMIDSDPLFVDPSKDDFHLTSPSPCNDTGDNTAVLDLYDFEGDPRIAYGTVDMGADEFYTHLYCTGDLVPGGYIEVKLIGKAWTKPVGLWYGLNLLDPPLKSKYGDWFLSYPYSGPIDLGLMPMNGVWVLSGILPSVSSGPYSIYMQALIGDKLTNLCTLDIDSSPPIDGAYQGLGIANDWVWFLVGDDGKNIINFSLYRPPDIEIDLVADLNKAVFPITVQGGQYIFDFSIIQPQLSGAVKAIYQPNQIFKCQYSIQTPNGNYSGTIDSTLFLSKDALGQSQKDYTFRDISVTLGAVNILDDGWSISFGDFNKDTIDDLFMPCSPSLYRYVWGSLNGLGYYLVDYTSKYGTPTDSRLHSLWTDVDSDGWNDLIAGGEIFRNISYGGTLQFENDQAYQIQEQDPEYCSIVDYNGDNDLDVFTGLWHTNKQDEDTQNPPYYELKFQQDYKINYTKNSCTMQGAFAPLEFNPAHAVPDVDLDLIELVQEANKVLKVYRCDRGANPGDPVTFTSDGQMPAAMATATSMAFGDVNNDLQPDLFVIGKDPNSTKLYINTTDTNNKPVDIEFQDMTVTVFNASGLAIPVGGDVDFADYDNDGWLDFFVAAPFGETTHTLYRNTMGTKGFLSFEDATIAAKITTAQPSGTYPRCTWCDIDNNGAMDLALGVHRLMIFQNAGGDANRLLRVQPMTNIGPIQTSTRAALGAIVLVDVDQNGSFDLIRCIESSRHDHLIAHFGLGLSSNFVDVQVYFPDGSVVSKMNIDLDMQQAVPLKVYDIN